jgi:SMODS and SLOG-associating 2TM effector domain 3/SMODS and SLOG-associating 2TM effector domain 1
MTNLELNRDTLPGLYQSADKASLNAQLLYFWCLRFYLILLIAAALVSFLWPKDPYGAMASAALFLVTLGILIALRVNRPDDLWYNGRAVAESVKTRSWRWSMRAEPYEDTDNIEIVSKQFINDLKAILEQNRSLSKNLQPSAEIQDPISETMREIRKLPIESRLEIYKGQRINNQAKWYALKSQFNKHRAMQWFWVSVFLHTTAIAILLYRIKNPALSLPVEVVATAAGSALTWLQAKKYNELSSSYTLAAHEIVLIKGEALSVKTEKDLSEFVFNSETAFSREHTQWAARKAE